MTKFEYRVLGLDARSAEVELNKMGNDGWEAIGFSEVACLRVILKRPVQSDKPFMVGV